MPYPYFRKALTRHSIDAAKWILQINYSYKLALYFENGSHAVFNNKLVALTGKENNSKIFFYFLRNQTDDLLQGRGP